jgi:predicted ATPase with chaperone activity
MGDKTLMVRAVPGIQPEMALTEVLKVTKIYSIADQLPAALVCE